MKKRLFPGLLASMMMVSMMATTVFAVKSETTNTEKKTEEHTVVVDSIEVSGGEIKLEIISPEEMEQLISDFEAGIITQNLFEDKVNVSFSRETKADGTEYCKVVIMNTGFIFDRVDLDGKIYLHNMSGIVMGKADIKEEKLVFGVARIVEIYPLGGHYATGSYELRVSDGDAGTVYKGTFI